MDTDTNKTIYQIDWCSPARFNRQLLGGDRVAKPPERCMRWYVLPEVYEEGGRMEEWSPNITRTVLTVGPSDPRYERALRNSVKVCDARLDPTHPIHKQQ